ncbi:MULTISPECIES: hypothetical protein [Streptomyces]|uniref:hypothetical protein n=1 Tax=Streptomyces TaxID=1883 RepID=UPI001A7E17F3|nr:hypothetical protein [Streptomyces sp. TSRI0395]
MGALSAYGAGKAQAKGMVAGVKLQLSGEREFALWTDRRDAYAAFHSSLEALRRSVGHAAGLTAAHLEGLPPPVAESYADARAQTNERFMELLSRESTLRLSVDSPESDRAGELTSLAQVAVGQLDDWVDAALSHRPSEEVQWRELQSMMARLEQGAAEWAKNARDRLQQGEGRDGERRP